MLSLAQPLGEGSYIVAIRDRLGFWSKERGLLLGGKLLPPDKRFNDGAIALSGEFVIGSMDLGESTSENLLMAAGPSGALQVLDSDLGLSNGIVHSRQTNLLYSVDSTKRKVYQRAVIGDLRFGPREVLHTFASGEPDGIAYSDTGHLLVPIWGEARISVLSLLGKEVASIPTPELFPTSIALASEAGEFSFLIGAQAPSGVDSDSGHLWRFRSPYFTREITLGSKFAHLPELFVKEED
jgi:sugar lactone lactonase YvrE